MPESTEFEFSQQAIGHVISDRQLSVPIYQRSYSWGAEQINDFWEDLNDALAHGESKYFLGNVVLSTEGQSDGYTIIDGQQRMATTLILLAAIRNEYKLRDDHRRAGIIHDKYLAVADLSSGEDHPRLQMNSDDDPYFRNLIINAKNPEDLTRLYSSHTLIRDALKYFTQKISEVAEVASTNWVNRLSEWAEFLERSVRIIVVDVPSESDAFLIFETLNDRGADLTIADLLKNYLFGKAGNQLDTVRDNWVAATSNLDTSTEQQSLFTTFLRHLWSSKYGTTRERFLYKGIKDRVSNQLQAVEFSQEILQSSRRYAALVNSEHDLWSGVGTGAKVNVETLHRLDLEQMRPFLLAAMQHFTEQELKRTLKALVAWGVRGLIVGGIGGGKTERTYCDAAVKVRDGEVKNATDALKELAEIIPSDTEFESNFAKARVTKTKLARYYLTALERTKRGDKEPELVPNQDEEQLNLEHILPQNPQSGDWEEFTEEEKRTWMHRVGNMTLLQKGPNGRIGNKPWTEKKPVLSNAQLLLTKEAGQHDTWTKETINDRQQYLASLAVQTWSRDP